MASLYTNLAGYLAGVKREFVLDNASTPYTIYPEADRIAEINEAREEISMETLCIPTRNTVTTIVGTQSYDLTSRNSKLVYVDFVTYGTKKLEGLYNRDDYYFIRTLTENATPENFYVDEGNKYLYLSPPPSAATTCYVYSFSVPSILVSGSATAESEIPVPYRKAVVSYALWKGYSRDGIVDGLTKADYYKKQFYEEMARAKARKKVGRVRGKQARITFESYGLRDTSTDT